MTTKTKLLAYHGDPVIKAKYLSRVQAHREADELIQSYGYWEDGKGCAVGCTIHGDDHSSYETEIGIPELLAHLEDAIFEGMPTDQANKWPERFLSAITPGTDLSMVWPRFSVWMLIDPDDGVIRFDGAVQGVANAINGVADLYREWITNGEKPDEKRWSAARAAASAAARAASNAAGDAASAAARAASDAAINAAWAAVWAASDAASDAARAATRAARDASDAARAAARAAARDAAWERMADKLIELLEGEKV